MCLQSAGIGEKQVPFASFRRRAHKGEDRRMGKAQLPDHVRRVTRPVSPTITVGIEPRGSAKTTRHRQSLLKQRSGVLIAGPTRAPSGDAPHSAEAPFSF
jgi:hypothetical protein